MFYLKANMPSLTPSAMAAARAQLHALELSQADAFLACVTKVLREDLGFRVSAETELAQLGNGEPIPMWTYGAVEYLMGLDLRNFDCLELGGGQSSLFFAKRMKSVRVIENNQEWADSLVARKTPNLVVDFAPRGTTAARMADLEGPFDLISIDCAENRFACVDPAVTLLKPGGMIVLDNSEWYPNTTAKMRSHDLIQVDFHDFRASHHYRTTTSLFLHPEFRAHALGPQLPLTPIGGRAVPNNNWDRRS